MILEFLHVVYLDTALVQIYLSNHCMFFASVDLEVFTLLFIL